VPFPVGRDLCTGGESLWVVSARVGGRGGIFCEGCWAGEGVGLFRWGLPMMIPGLVPKMIMPKLVGEHGGRGGRRGFFLECSKTDVLFRFLIFYFLL
jgi:hypothetical protein